MFLTRIVISGRKASPFTYLKNSRVIFAFTKHYNVDAVTFDNSSNLRKYHKYTDWGMRRIKYPFENNSYIMEISKVLESSEHYRNLFDLSEFQPDVNKKKKKKKLTSTIKKHESTKLLSEPAISLSNNVEDPFPLASVGKIDADQSVIYVTMNSNPDNTFSEKFLNDFEGFLSALEEDFPSYEPVVLSAQGTFSMGLDYGYTLQLGVNDMHQYISRINDALLQLYTLERRTIAAISGSCADFGLILALACDHRAMPLMFSKKDQISHASFYHSQQSNQWERPSTPIVPKLSLRNPNFPGSVIPIQFPSVAQAILNLEVTKPNLRMGLISGQKLTANDGFSGGLIDIIVKHPIELLEKSFEAATNSCNKQGYDAMKSMKYWLKNRPISNFLKKKQALDADDEVNTRNDFDEAYVHGIMRQDIRNAIIRAYKPK